MTKFRCKLCGTTIEVEGNLRHIIFSRDTTPYGSRDQGIKGYPHSNMRDCPLAQGLSEPELKTNPMVEVLEG